MDYAELQATIKAYLDQQQYDKALPKWELIQKAIEKLSLNELQEHIKQAHVFAKHFLATSQAPKADDLYQRLKNACLQLNQFGVLEQIQFYQAVAGNYEVHGKDAEALTYYTQGLYLGERDNHVEFVNLFTDKLNQLHNKLFTKLITPYVKPQIETAKSRLHVAKQRSLEEFTAVSDNFLLLATALEQKHQWGLAVECYEAVVSNAERLAQFYPTLRLIAKITELSRYERNETKPIELTNWQTYRRQLQRLRQRFVDQSNAQSILGLQTSFSRDLKKLLADVLKQIEGLLGEKPCAFSFIALGSLAREDACPYSDIDFALLVSDESKRHNEYFQVLIQLFSLTVNLIGEPNGLAIDSGDLGYLTGKDKICLNTPTNLAKRFSPSKYEEILSQPETHALHRPALLYASAGGENLLIDYQNQLQQEWIKYRSQWVSRYVRLHYDAWEVLGKKIGGKHVTTTANLKEEYLRPLLLWCSDIALHVGIEAVSIPDSLAAFANRQILDSDFIRELTVAIEKIQKLRIELQLKLHAQEEKLDVLKNMTAGLELERIRSQVLVPAYEILIELESEPEAQLEEWDPVFLFLFKFTTVFANPPSITTSVSFSSSSSSASVSNMSSQKTVSSQLLEQAIQTYVDVVSQRSGLHMNSFAQAMKSLPETSSTTTSTALTTSSSSSSTSSADSSPFAGQDAQTFMDAYSQFFGKIGKQSYLNCKIYNLLSPKLRAFYLEQFEAVKPQSNAIFLDALYRYPDSAGLRKSSERQMTAWEATLLNLTEPANQNTQATTTAMTVTFEWFTSRGQKEGRVLKPYYVEQLWGSQGKLGGHDKLSDGRRLVRPLQDPSGKLVAYIKVYPELPGIQLSVNSLAQHISGEGMKSTVVRATAVSSSSKIPVVYPLLLSEPVLGKTLQQILREQGHLNEIEAKLYLKSFTLKVLESLLGNPEDDKADNLVAETFTDTVYRILSVDGDHAFVDPLVQTGTVLNRQEKVQVKSILYCMDAMLKPLDQAAIEEFLLLDPFQVLTDWLSGLHVYNQRTIGNRELNLSGLFSEQELQKYAEGKDFCFVQAFFEPGWITSMYEKFIRLQTALRENPPSNHLELLALIEPHLAQYYEKVFAEHTTAHQRFQALPTEYVTVVEKQTSTVKYQSTLKNERKGFKIDHDCGSKKEKDLKVALREGSLFTPDKAQKTELQMIHDRYQRLQETRNKILQGSVEVLSQIEHGDFFKEKVVNSLDFSKLNESVVKKLLQHLPSISFFSLSLAGCGYLTDELLSAILKASPNLLELDVTDCVQLTDDSFCAVAKHCKHLMKLTMGNTSLKAPGAGLKKAVQFNSLRRLRLPRCEKLTALVIDASQLEQVQLIGCIQLNELKFKSRIPKFLDIQGCRFLEAQKSRITDTITIVDGNNTVPDFDTLQSLLANCAYCINHPNSNGEALLNIAAGIGADLKTIQFLIDSGAMIDQTDRDGKSALHNAAMCQIEIRFQIRDLGELIEGKSYKWDPVGRALKFTYSVTAFHARYLNVMRALLGAGAKVDQVDELGATPLHYTAHYGKAELTQILLRAGASVNQQVAKDGSTPLHCLFTADSVLIFPDMEPLKRKIRRASNLPRQLEVKELESLEFAKKIIGNDAVISRLVAFQKEKLATLQALLDARADVESIDNDGSTPLCIAATGDIGVEALQMLLRAGAKVDHVNTLGRTPLCIAAAKGTLETQQALLLAGANVNHADSEGWTPLCFAADEGREESLLLLLRMRANVDQAMNNGATPLLMATEKGHLEAMQVLLRAGAKVNQAMNNGATPLYIAAQEAKVDKMLMLLAAGATVDLAINDGFIPLYSAVLKGHVEIVKILLAYQPIATHKALLSKAQLIANKTPYAAVIDLLNDYLKDPVAKQKEYRREVDEQTKIVLARINASHQESEQIVDEVIKKFNNSALSSSSDASYSSANLIMQQRPFISAPAVATRSASSTSATAGKTTNTVNSGAQNSGSFRK